MKRSKIILGMTTGILAIAAVAVAKKNQKVGFYCTKPNHAGQCKSFIPPSWIYLATGKNICTVGAPYLGRTVYTAGIIVTGQDCGNSQNCMNPFRWTNTGD